MAETVSMNKIYKTLVALKKEVDYIKANMVEADMFLTQEEHVELDESLKELEAGKTFSLETIEKDRENA